MPCRFAVLDRIHRAPTDAAVGGLGDAAIRASHPAHLILPRHKFDFMQINASQRAARLPACALIVAVKQGVAIPNHPGFIALDVDVVQIDAVGDNAGAGRPGRSTIGRGQERAVIPDRHAVQPVGEHAHRPQRHGSRR